MAESNQSSEIHLNVFGRTDVGQIREHNEDNFLVADLSRGSRSLLEADRNQIVGETDRDDLARRLVPAVEDAGIRIFNEARADRTRRGMGTTATIAALLDERLFVAQVGDSRAYVLRNGKLIQVTRDQSLVNQLIEAGQLTEEEAETFEHNNIILQALGTADTVQVDLTYVDLRKGDRIVLCSDGLSGMIRADEIREVLNATPDPLEACKILTERANLAGGHDNITVIVGVFDGPSLKAPSEDELPKYSKYALPDSTTGSTVRPPARSMDDIEVGDLSDEALREQRKLKVGHTLIGMTTPNLDGVESDTESSEPESPAPKHPSTPPPVFSLDDEPVHIPTSGLPPSAVGFMVLAALVVVAVAGFFALR